MGLRIRPTELPAFAHALELASKPLAGGAHDNEQAVAPFVDRAPGLCDARVRLASDAQTSGGLLATVPAETVEAVLRDLQAAGTPAAVVIGEVVAEHPGRIALVA